MVPQSMTVCLLESAAARGSQGQNHIHLCDVSQPCAQAHAKDLTMTTQQDKIISLSNGRKCCIAAQNGPAACRQMTTSQHLDACHAPLMRRSQNDPNTLHYAQRHLACRQCVLVLWRLRPLAVYHQPSLMQPWLKEQFGRACSPLPATATHQQPHL